MLLFIFLYILTILNSYNKYIDEYDSIIYFIIIHTLMNFNIIFGSSLLFLLLCLTVLEKNKNKLPENIKDIVKTIGFSSMLFVVLYSTSIAIVITTHIMTFLFCVLLSKFFISICCLYVFVKFFDFDLLLYTYLNDKIKTNHFENIKYYSKKIKNISQTFIYNINQKLSSNYNLVKIFKKIKNYYVIILSKLDLLSNNRYLLKTKIYLKNRFNSKTKMLKSKIINKNLIEKLFSQNILHEMTTRELNDKTELEKDLLQNSELKKLSELFNTMSPLMTDMFKNLNNKKKR